MLTYGRLCTYVYIFFLSIVFRTGFGGEGFRYHNIFYQPSQREVSLVPGGDGLMVWLRVLMKDMESRW